MSVDDASKGAKLGRKGDVRMHNAVNARLANPEMSLFEALQIGGFNYPANEDATAVDSEGVSLGQRKNQLSRRLRLARKQNPGARRETDSYSIHSERSAEALNSAGGAAGLSSEAQKELQRLVQLKARNDSKKPAAASNKIAARALQMKRDQGEIGDLSDEENPYAASAYQQEDQSKRPRIAKFHPDFAPLFVPPVSSVRGGGTPKNSDPPMPQHNGVNGNVLPPGTMGGLGMGFGQAGLNVAGPLPSSFPTPNPYTQSFAHAFPGQQSHSRPSAVAISSLTHSAQAVGLTLEQLAMTLASNTTSLAKVLAEDAAQDAQSKKMDLALRLFEVDVKALYSKALLMGGFDPRDCQQNTLLYQEFARKAWEREAKRLRAQARAVGDYSFDELDRISGVASATTADVESLDKETDHDHDHDHSTNNDHHDDEGEKKCGEDCDYRHIHRIDGQCGHKAIIHKPKDGNAHIDFVVGDKVECYHGIEPLGKNFDAAWPSRYKCREAGDHGNCGSENFKGISEIIIPKIFDLSEINLQDPEWNYDVTGSIDGGVAGLFRLGAKSDDLTV